RSTAPAWPSASAPASWPSKRNVRTTTAHVTGRFVFLSESKRLAQAQVQRKACRPRPTIDRHKRTRIRFVAIESHVVRDICTHKYLIQLPKRRPVVEDRIAVQILSKRHIERSSRSRNQERTQPELIRHGNAAAEENPIAHIERSAPIIL